MIRLDRLTVRGFRSIRALEDFELGDLTVLIGPNGAGKSNFLDLFRMGASIAAERLQIFVAERDGPDALLFGGVRRTDRIDAAFAFHTGEYAFSLFPAGNRLLFVAEGTREGDGNPRVLTLRPRRYSSITGRTREGDGNPRVLALGGREESRLAESRELFANHAAGAMKGWRVHRFADTGPTARLRRAQPLRDDLRLQTDGGNLSPFLRMLRERFPLHHHRIVEATRFVAPFLGDFVSREHGGERVELEWSEAGAPDRVLGARQLSDGTLRFICLATLLLQPVQFQPNPILIDEPELGAHPYAIAQLAELLREASNARQIVVSTQSADLVSELEPEDIVTVDRRDGESVFRRLDSESLEDWLKDYTLGDLWKSHVVGDGPAR